MLKKYPNVNRFFGEMVIDNLPASEDVLENGVVYNKLTASIGALEDGTVYNLSCPITDNSIYNVLLVIGVEHGGYRPAYTTYELSNMPNQNDNVTQFDVAIK